MKTLNLDQPIFFERNRVYRVYLGGEPYPEFFGTDEEGDNNFPEEWVASTVKAINPVTFTDRDGVSKIRGTDLYFDDVLKENKEKLHFWLTMQSEKIPLPEHLRVVIENLGK